MTLVVAPCDHGAAKYAVERWHYSHRLPVGKLVTFGVWESGCFIGAVIFSRGANHHLGSPYGLRQTQICELTRVAFDAHHSPASQIVRQALRLLARNNPGLRLVLSYADPEHGHHGAIYQAMNWVYVGGSSPQGAVEIAGRVVHKRVVSARYGTCSIDALRERGLSASWTQTRTKHTYLFPLDRAMRRQLIPLARPYPHAVEVSTETRPAASRKGQVQTLRTAPTVSQ